MPSLVKTASEQAYNPAGDPAIVNGASTLIPGVDLTAIPTVGRGMLIAPDVVARAFHNRGPVGDPYTFVALDGTQHTRTQTVVGGLLGGDLVLARLDTPLPSTIKPMRISPTKFEGYIEEGERLHLYRTAYNGGFRLSLGDYDPTRRFFFNQDEILTLNSHWSEAVGGDSGGGYFIVLDGEPFAVGPARDAAETGTPIPEHETEVMDFAPDSEFFDFYFSAHNVHAPVQGVQDETVIYLPEDDENAP